MLKSKLLPGDSTYGDGGETKRKRAKRRSIWSTTFPKFDPNRGWRRIELPFTGRPSRVSLIHLMIRPPPRSSHLRCTTLFRSKEGEKTVNLVYHFSQIRSQSWVAKDRTSIHG